MFSGFPSELRKHGLHADARTILQLYQLMSRGLIQDLGGLYSGAERLVVKDSTERGPFTIAFFSHFLDIHIAPGQTLDEAVLQSDTFDHWRHDHAPEQLPSPELVDQFLESIFNQSPYAKGRAAVPEFRAQFSPDIDVEFFPSAEMLDELGEDYSEEDLAELVRKMQAVAAQQEEAHRGGNKFIGTDGTSPYGHSGQSSGGIRVGGRAARLSARVVLNNPRYFPVDVNAMLSDNNVDAALAALKGIAERQSRLQVDIPETIRIGAKRGGLFLPQLRQVEDELLNVLLFIDNGGYSMDVHIPVVRALFQKMKTRFTHDLRIFYFHNIIYSTVYSDEARAREPVALDSLLSEGKRQSVFIVGDASMAPYELFGAGWGKSGYECLLDLAEAFPRLAWLNPVRQGSWYGTETIGEIRRLMRMFPLTPRGIEQAVTEMNRVSAKAFVDR